MVYGRRLFGIVWFLIGLSSLAGAPYLYGGAALLGYGGSAEFIMDLALGLFGALALVTGWFLLAGRRAALWLTMASSILLMIGMVYLVWGPEGEIGYLILRGTSLDSFRVPLIILAAFGLMWETWVKIRRGT